MATRRYNGHRHHTKKHPSNDQNKRRLSKQEEIDLTVDGIDCEDKSTNFISGEPTIAPAIHVNSVDDKSSQKSMSDKEMNDTKEDMDLNDTCNQSMRPSLTELEESFSGKLSVNDSNSLTTDDNREKKRGKHLTRGEAVRDSSASPPPALNSETDEKISNTLTVNSSNSQSQNSLNSNNQSKIKAQGSSGSLDRSSSPCLSRDSSTENYSDLNGTDVQQFLIETLLKNKKDRVFLLKIELDLNVLVKDTQKTSLKFAPMTSYNRMLVHRVAALFGFEHNVDGLGTSVVVNKSKNTRIPDLKFKDYIKEDSLHEPKKSILKRDSASLEEGSNCSSISFDGKEKSPDRQMGTIGDSRSKSFEEREERYEKARARIFNQDSSSSTEGMDANSNQSPDSFNNSFQRDSSPRSSQSNEDLAAKANHSTEVRNWSSTDSDSSGLNKSDPKSTTTSNDLKPVTSLDTMPELTQPLPSSSCAGMSLLNPNSSLSVNNGCPQTKSRPSVTKASSFSGISHNVDDRTNSTQTHLSKSGSFNAPQNLIHNQSGVYPVVNSDRSNTPKNNLRQEGANKPVVNNQTSHHSNQRYVSSQQTSIHSSNASHHNRHHNWHQNSHQRNNRIEREQSFGSVQWPQNYPQFIVQQQNDSNVNQMKDNQYLQQSGHQLYLSSVPTYGPNVSNEAQQHLTQTPIRLLYPNPNQPQMRPNINHMMNSSVNHQNVSNQMSSVPFPLQSNASPLNFSGNQSNIPNNQMINSALSHSYGAPLQVPSNVGTVWIFGNGINPQSSSPLMTCPPPANTPPNSSIGSNIAPFVGMSYQQYRPPLNSNVSLNPNLSLSAAQNRGNAPLLKNQPLLANNQRIMASNGNHYIQQQVQDVVDMNNLMGANNYLNRAPVIPQVNHLRRMPANSNQGLDVRLVGQQASPPFLLPTPQRPYFPVSNSVTVNHRSFYANNANNVNQRSKHSFSKNKTHNNRYNNANNRNILVPNNTNTNFSNT